MKIAGLKSFKQLGDEVARREAAQRKASRLQTASFELTVAKYTEKAVAFADGTTEDLVDKETGEVKSRAKWFWFPKSVVSIEDYEDAWPEVGENVIAHLPQKMAEERGLL